MIKRLAIALALVCALAGFGAAQKQMKAWTEWSKKDAEKMLSDSPWAQTQVETDLSEMFFVPTKPGGFNDPARKDEGATNQEVNLRYYVRFFSARPIRMALARMMAL